MSEWSKKLARMDPFKVNNRSYQYIRQLSIQNISKEPYRFEIAFRTIVDNLLAHINDQFELRIPITPNEEAVGYLAFHHNSNNLKALEH